MTINKTNYRLRTMNIELTTKCPLRCPQCYCTLAGGKNIPLETAVYWIRQGGLFGVAEVALSGGETMCYPHIYDVIAAAKRYCGGANIALSGYGVTQEAYERLIESGVTGIYISLNGSTEEINKISRDGYDLAIAALDLLRRNRCPISMINWVMHSSNADDLQSIIQIAERYSVGSVVILAAKPDSNHMLSTLPTREQMLRARDYVQAYRGSVRIVIEPCFSPMRALVSDTKLLGNLNVGMYKGCVAGISAFSVNVDGMLSPCRHLEFFESHATLLDYLEESAVLNTIRNVDNDRRDPCINCKYADYCRHCLAINAKTRNELFIGNERCAVFEKVEA